MKVEEKKPLTKWQKFKAGIPKGTFSAGGGLLASSIFGPEAAPIGAGIGNILSKIVGFGKYRFKRNTLMQAMAENKGRGKMNLKEGQPMPVFASTKNGFEISHREFVTDVTGSTNFENVLHAVNPGNEYLFPWLAQVAHYFEEYVFLGLLFEYRPSSGMVAATPSLGTVMMATNYNCTEPKFASKAEIDSYEYATSCVPSQGMIHPIECSPNNNPLNRYYVRTLQNPDARLFYDIGNLNIATKGMSSAYTCGEIWVSYHVLLQRPRLNVHGPGSPYALYESTSVCDDTTFFSDMEIDPLVSTSELLSFPTGKKIAFERPGVYLLTVETSGATATSAYSIVLGADIIETSATNAWNGTTVTRISNLTVGHLIDGTSNVMTFTGAATLTVGSTRVTITAIPMTSSIRKPMVLSQPVHPKVAEPDVVPEEEEYVSIQVPKHQAKLVSKLL